MKVVEIDFGAFVERFGDIVWEALRGERFRRHGRRCGQRSAPMRVGAGESTLCDECTSLWDDVMLALPARLERRDAGRPDAYVRTAAVNVARDIWRDDVARRGLSTRPDRQAHTSKWIAELLTGDEMDILETLLWAAQQPRPLEPAVLPVTRVADAMGCGEAEAAKAIDAVMAALRAARPDWVERYLDNGFSAQLTGCGDSGLWAA